MSDSANSKFKDTYKVPFTLDSHFGDAPIQILSRTGEQIGPSDLTLRPFLVTSFSILLFVYCAISSGLSQYFLEGSFLGQFLVTFGYIGIVYFALREISVPGLYGYNVVFPFTDYIMSKRNHLIRIGDEQPYTPVSQFIGMSEPDSSGHLNFNDGNHVGQLFKITGTASHNTFQIDRQATIEDFNDFLRQLPSDATISFVTNTGGQNVNTQISHLLDLFDRTEDVLMQTYITEEVKELYGYVQDNFVTLHQYMLIIGDDRAAFKNAFNVIREFADRNGLVISSISIPSKKHNYAFFRNIYSGIQNEQVLTNRLKKFKETHKTKSDLEVAGSLTPTEKTTNTTNKNKRKAKTSGIKIKRR